MGRDLEAVRNSPRSVSWSRRRFPPVYFFLGDCILGKSVVSVFPLGGCLDGSGPVVLAVAVCLIVVVHFTKVVRPLSPLKLFFAIWCGPKVERPPVRFSGYDLIVLLPPHFP